MLGQRSDFRVDSSLSAENTGQANLSSVSLQRTIDQGTSHSDSVPGFFSIGECLVSGLLLQAVQVCDRASTTGGSSISQETKDGISNPQRVVQIERGADEIEEYVVGMFLRNLPDLVGMKREGTG